MERKLKLIWDFRGPAAAMTAKHHAVHLREYIAAEKLALDICGHEDHSEMYSTAFLVVQETQMPSVRDRLKPHRGEVYEG